MVHVAAAIIRNERGEILICQRGAGGDCAFLWEFPGGKVEDGETREQCLVRECKEELDVSIEVRNFFGETTYQYPTQEIVIAFFQAKMVAGELNMKVHEAWRWVHPDELAQYHFCPADVEILERIKLNDGGAGEEIRQTQRHIFAKLAELGIHYTLLCHPAVYTIEEMDHVYIGDAGVVVKNLFLRDDKKQRYFLLTLCKDKKTDLKELSGKLQSRRLMFASESDLQSYLGLRKGAVSPLGILNDGDCKVEVVVDVDVLKYQRIGVHPNENTATVWIRPQDLERVIQSQGNKIWHIEI